MRRVWRSVLGASGALAVGAGLLSGQVQQQGAASGKLNPIDARATAISEYLTALDAYQNLSWTEGFLHAQRAFTADSSFGLARALYARYRAGPNAVAEARRAAADAVSGSTAEAIIALANASSGPAAAGLWDLAVKLHPNDPRVATDRALAMGGRARIDALRDVANKFADQRAHSTFHKSEATWQPQRLRSRCLPKTWRRSAGSPPNGFAPHWRETGTP